jgi:uncharacterized RDD family membrane protein YckC
VVDREPSLLGTEPEVASDAPTGPAEAPRAPTAPAVRAPSGSISPPAVRAPTEQPLRAATAKPIRAPSPAVRRETQSTVHVVGFWKRAGAGAIDLAVILPVAALLIWITSSITGVHVPSARMHGPDFWLDLFLASDPVLLMALGLFTAIGCVYLYVFHVTMGRTLGMHVLKMRVIDVWGDTPSNARCAVRTAGYIANALTFFLGFLWIGFDSEKRGLHDWMAGTYVIKG